MITEITNSTVGRGRHVERWVLAGGSGFLGRVLATYLTQMGREVIILTRHPEHHVGPGKAMGWDGKTTGPWCEALDGADVLVNLAGRSVDCRATAVQRQVILDSRVDSVSVLGAALKLTPRPPRVWIQSASTAIYGNAGERWCDELAPLPNGYPVNVCRAWERTFHEQVIPGVRSVLLRISFVLGRDGGALGRLEALTRCFLGGAVGSGQQYISWLHERDWCRVVQWCADHGVAEGTFNVATPNPVTNAQFMQAMRDALHRPWSPPTPAWAVRLGAWAMGTDPMLALTGRRVAPQRLQRLGFVFQYPHLAEALGHLFDHAHQEAV